MRFTLSYFPVVERRRNELGMSREDLAAISRVDYAAIRNIEDGKKQTINANDLDALCEALDLQGEDLCYDYFTRPPEAKLTMVYPRVEILLEHLNSTGLSPSEFAARAKCDIRTVRRCMDPNAKRKIARTFTLQRLADALGCEPAVFTCGYPIMPVKQIKSGSLVPWDTPRDKPTQPIERATRREFRRHGEVEEAIEYAS